MAEQIADRYNQSRQLKVNEDGSINTGLYVFGTAVDSDNPLPTTQQLKIDTVIEDVAFDLNAAAYSEVATPTYDYIIDNVTFDFTTTESRTITITSDNGTKLYEATNTNLNVAVTNINFGQETGQTFTVAITQTTGACSVDVTADIKNSPVALTADPVIAPGTSTIGNVGLVDEDGDDIEESNPLQVEGQNAITEGTVKKDNIVDLNGDSFSSEILKQLKIMNIHLSILTDNTIKKTEVE